jgi:transglutaminase superfamily protein
VLKHRIAIAAVALFAVPAAQAHASTGHLSRADKLMARVADKATHGWKDNKLPLETLERRIAQGRRVYVTCSIQAELAMRLARRHGIPARHASTLTNRPFNGHDDGHSLMEIKLGGHWVLYDIDANTVAVDARGHRIGLAAQVKAGRDRRWKTIANDKLYDIRGIPAPVSLNVAYIRRVFDDSASWYQRAFGVALIETSPGMFAYHGSGHRSSRVESVWPGHYRWVNAQTWRHLTA